MPANLRLPLFVPRTDQSGVLPCAEPGVNPDELFFGHAPDTPLIEAALKMCQRCPVSLDCRSFARDAKERGLWGGEPETVRSKHARESRAHS
ncbi:WhiB family transcriptional regulator [Streptomyces sp. NPDC057910]|uniref:WhiB family transcriptional regulator n=1 Tax=Streptomyces sp. NPDC057910 TaxID=3346278 RepID=UPI0036E32349